MSDSTGNTQYCYDLRGNTITKQLALNGQGTGSVQYAYNSADRLTGIIYPSTGGASASYARDADGRLIAIAEGSTSIVTAISYLPFGPATQYTFAQGGQTLTKTYDANYRATDIAGSALNLHFKLDALGDITAEGDASGVPAPNETYQYDPLYRLQQVNDQTGQPWQSYSYNKTGDRLSKTTAGQTPMDTYNYQTGTHRLLSITGADASSRAFDANGNTTALQANGFMYGLGYDDRNRLSLVQQNGNTTKTYGLNGKGERVTKSGGNFYIYDEAGKLLGESSVDGYAFRLFIWADATLVATSSGYSNVLDYVYTDHLGTPRAVTTPTSSTPIWTWPWLQNPFGEKPASGSSYTLNLRFPGQYFDAETGFNYNYFRDYEAGTGRYIQSDPSGLYGGPNTYAYADGRPVTVFDFFGLASGTSACCAMARQTILADARNKDADGTVACCGGQKISCVWSEPDASAPPASIIHLCKIKHEDQHKSNAPCPCGCGQNCVLKVPPQDQNSDECQSYRTQLDCLIEHSRDCGNNTQCRAAIIAEIAAVRTLANLNYGGGFTK